MIITTKAGDVLDLLCYRHLNSTQAIATILHNNPQLADLDPQGLPAGIEIDMGDVSLTTITANAEAELDTDAVFLWD